VAETKKKPMVDKQAVMDACNSMNSKKAGSCQYDEDPGGSGLGSTENVIFICNKDKCFAVRQRRGGPPTGPLLEIMGRPTAQSSPQAALPTPVIRLVTSEHYWVGRTPWVRFELSVENREDFASSLFDAIPTEDQAPCPAGLSNGRLRFYVRDLGVPLSFSLHQFCPAKRNDLAVIRVAAEKRMLLTNHLTISIHDRLASRWVSSNVVQIPTRPREAPRFPTRPSAHRYEAPNR